MKCIVFSDSHGELSAMRRALSRHKDADAVFFLGDGLRDAFALCETEKNFTWFFVKGNCDFLSKLGDFEIPKTDSVILAGKKIVFTHGDLYGVKYGNGGLVRLAEESSADIVLYGHTHRATEDYLTVRERGVYLLNPGSVGQNSSFGILDIDENGTLFSISADL